MAGKKRLLILTGFYIILLLFVTLYYTCQFIEQAAVISLKKLYSAYSQALYLTAAEMEGETGCYYSTDKSYPGDFSGCDRFYKNFATNLKVIKYCKNNSLLQGCLPRYKKYSITPACAGFSESMINKFDQSFIMQDKTSITVFNQPQNVQKPLFVVDSNGKLFPNKSGYDFFSFVIMRNKSGNYYFHSNITYCLPAEKGGVHMLQDIYK